MNKFLTAIMWFVVSFTVIIGSWLLYSKIYDAFAESQAISRLTPVENEVRDAHIRLIRAYLEYDIPHFFRTLMIENYTYLDTLYNKSFVLNRTAYDHWEKIYEEGWRPYGNYRCETHIFDLEAECKDLYLSGWRPKKGFSLKNVMNPAQIEIYGTGSVPDRYQNLLLNYSMNPGEYLAIVPVKKSVIFKKNLVPGYYWIQVYRRINETWIAMAGDFNVGIG